MSTADVSAAEQAKIEQMLNAARAREVAKQPNRPVLAGPLDGIKAPAAYRSKLPRSHAIVIELAPWNRARCVFRDDDPMNVIVVLDGGMFRHRYQFRPALDGGAWVYAGAMGHGAK